MYARVSSEQQAEAQTIASQVAALRERVAAAGLPVPEVMQFLEEGDSGATLVRPALERVRDVVAARAVARLYVHSPDRLARQYAYQVLLVDEFRRAGGRGHFFQPGLRPESRGGPALASARDERGI